jgi:uncharacterized protein
MNKTRRYFVRGLGGSVLAAASVGLYGRFIESNWIETTRHRLPVRHLPPTLEGKTLVHLSDLHLGHQVSDNYLREVFERVEAYSPDFIVYTGDFTTYGDGILEKAKSLFAGLPKAKIGSFGVLGNHDYGPGIRDYEHADRLSDIIEQNGVHVLRNTRVHVAGLTFIGLDDLWAQRFHPEKAFDGLDSGSAAIAMSHNPDTVDLPGWEGFQGWVLAGHTHGGQCKVPFLPPPRLPTFNRRYVAGTYDINRNLRMFISRGVGHLLPIRFNVRPEMTLFQLSAKEIE